MSFQGWLLILYNLSHSFLMNKLHWIIFQFTNLRPHRCAISAGVKTFQNSEVYS